MALDVNKLIADTKAAQETARKTADEEAKLAAKDRANAEVAALSKKQLDYADSLKPTLAEYEAGLRNFARKIGLGDKLSEVEQKEFSRLQSNYKSLTKTIDSAIKKANDILVEARRSKASLTPKAATTGTGTATGPDAARLGTTPKVSTDVTTSGNKGGTTGGNKGGTKDGTKGITTGVNFAQNSGVSTTTAAGIAAASAGTGVNDAAANANVGAGGDLNTLLAKTEFWYDLPDYIFKVDDKIGKILLEAVNGNWDSKKFMAKVELTPWWQRNAGVIRTKIIEREKYNDLKKLGEDVSKTEYGIYLGKQMRFVKNKAQELANVALTDEQAQGIAQKIYDGNLEDDPLAINALIIPFIGKTPSIAGNGTQIGFGGKALQDYQMLQSIAKKNGFKLIDILPKVSAITAGGDLETAVLRGLADGSIDINRVAQDARMLAAQGQPKYVRDLLSQGYDLQDVYAPYREQMARELDLDVNQIELNDPTLRMGITDKGDMNLYDFTKALRKDNRWQYSSSAREEVSSSVLGVLRDFGFQG